jgi:anti-sigma factor RsiW
MNGHLGQWLDAYLDGEMDDARKVRVEAHLQSCAQCRGELERRRALSGILQADPFPAGGKSEQRFVSEIALRLPRKPAAVRPRIRVSSMVWGAAPAAVLFLAWAFLQAAAVVVEAVNWIPGAENALQAGLLAPLPRFSMPDFGGQPLVALPGWVSWDGVVLTAALVGIGLLFTGWLAGWWISQRAAGSHQ